LDNLPRLSASDLAEKAKNGVLNGLFRVSDEDYHSGPGLSASGVVDFIRSPAHYLAAKQGAKKPTPAMMFGTKVHEYMLQPEVFAAKYAVEPEGCDGPKNRNPWKALWENFKKECEETKREPVDRKEYTDLVGIGESLSSHNAASSLLLEANGFEIAVYEQRDGLIRKAKADILLDYAVADLKTTQDARPKPFLSSVRGLLYHVKAAWYLDLFKPYMPNATDFIWAAVETSSPYAVACYVASPAMMEKGRGIYEDALKTFAICSEKNLWPSYPDEFSVIDLPPYDYREDV